MVKSIHKFIQLEKILDQFLDLPLIEGFYFETWSCRDVNHCKEFCNQTLNLQKHFLKSFQKSGVCCSSKFAHFWHKMKHYDSKPKFRVQLILQNKCQGCTWPSETSNTLWLVHCVTVQHRNDLLLCPDQYQYQSIFTSKSFFSLPVKWVQMFHPALSSTTFLCPDIISRGKTGDIL